MATVGKILTDLRDSRRCGELSAGIIENLRGLLVAERRKAKNAKRRASRQRRKLREKLAMEEARTDQLHADYKDLYYENLRLRETIEEERVTVEEAAKKVADIQRAHQEDVDLLYDTIGLLQNQLTAAGLVPGWGGQE